MILRWISDVPASIVLPRARAGNHRSTYRYQSHGCRRPFKLPVRAQQFLGNLLEALVQLTPENLSGWKPSGPGTPVAIDAAKGTHLVAAHDFKFRHSIVPAFCRMMGSSAAGRPFRCMVLDRSISRSMFPAI